MNLRTEIKRFALLGRRDSALAKSRRLKILVVAAAAVAAVALGIGTASVSPRLTPEVRAGRQVSLAEFQTAIALGAEAAAAEAVRTNDNPR
jgi:hypothetical protein